MRPLCEAHFRGYGCGNFLQQVCAVATVNYSVPEDLKTDFNQTFQGRNKSAIIAALMREAIDRERTKQESHEAIMHILGRRHRAPVVSDARVRATRLAGRP